MTATLLRLCWLAASVLGHHMVWAQAFPIVPPQLPTRGAAVAGVPAPAPAYSSGGYNATPQPAPTYPGGYGGAPQPAPTYPATSYAPAYAPAYGSASTAVPAAAPRAASGVCRLQVSPDRQTLSLVSGEPPLPREHVPLGEFRANQVVHSADGRWGVAYIKLRGQAQFAAQTFDLERCTAQRTVGLPAAGADVEFAGDQAVLLLEGGSQQRIALRDGSVR